MTTLLTDFGPKPLKDWSDDDWRTLGFDVQDSFSPAAPISEAEQFSGRKAEIDRLISAVFERGRHPVLFGEKGVGKTSLGNTFHKLIGGNAPRTLLPIWHQITPDNDFHDIWSAVFNEIVVEYEDDNNELRRERLSENYDHIRPADIIRELKAASEGRNKVIILDEYDKLEDDEAQQLIPHTIKAISDRGINATVMLIGVADNIDQLIEDHSSVSRNLTEIKMPRMSESEAELLIVERAKRLRFQFAADAKWKVIRLAQGLPSYVHQLARDAMLNAISQRTLQVTEAHVDEAIKTLTTQSDHSSYSAYRQATESNDPRALYESVLLACSIAKSDDLGHFKQSDVVEPLAAILNKKVTIATFTGHLAKFSSPERGCILEKVGGGAAHKYRFTDPKMQPYVVMRGVATGKLDEGSLSVFTPTTAPYLFPPTEF